MKTIFAKRLTGITLLVSIIVSGCKTVQLADINVGNPVQNKLPALDFSNDKTAITSPMPYPYGYGYANIQDDARSMFTKLIQENITDPLGEKYGYVSYNIVVGTNKLSGWGYYLPSILSLTTLNLFGMPYFTAKSSVEITVQISNSDKEVIGIYKGTGESKKYVAYYYGYGLMDALRAANIESLKTAFSSISSQIEKQSSELVEKLKEKGAIKK